MLHYRLLYLKYLPLPVSGKAAAVLRTCPPLSLLYYFNSCQPNLFKIAPLCISFLFICTALIPNYRRENVVEKRKKKKRDRILGSYFGQHETICRTVFFDIIKCS